MNKKLVIQFGERKIVAEIDDTNTPDIPPELYVYLCDNDNNIIQDVCLVRPHYEVDPNDGVFERDNGRVDCIVWADENQEDYTNKYVIGVYEEDKQYENN